MPPEDDFRRDRDPRRRRNAGVAGALAGAGLVALAAALWLGHGHPATTAPLTPTISSPPSPPAPSPPPRSLAPTPVPGLPVLGFSFSAVYDPAVHRLVTFGGVDSYDGTWVWDGQAWSLSHPAVAPPGRFAAAAAYDPLTGVVMLYGGRLGPGQVVDDTWAWDGGTWRELDAGTGSPPAGEGSVMAWDGSVDEMVLAAAPSAGGGTWTWNGSRWVRQPGGDLPAGTSFVGMVVDPVTRRLIGVSCCAPGSGATSTFAWDGATWRRVVTATTPGFTVALVADPGSGRLLMFGDPSTDSGHDTWSWSGRNWVLVAGARLPQFPAAAVTDTDSGHVLILGSDLQPVQGNPQPVHLWSLSGTAWRRLA